MSMPSNLLSNAKEILTDLQNDIDGLQKIWAEIEKTTLTLKRFLKKTGR